MRSFTVTAAWLAVAAIAAPEYAFAWQQPGFRG